MTSETVECFNCGRANPEWAQVCRTCGVPLRHGEARTAPTGRLPTDRDSLISMGSVIATIIGALLLGLFVANLNPTDVTVGLAPTATPVATPTSTPVPSESPIESASVAPTPSPTPVLPGTVVFGTNLDANRQVTDPTDTFTPGMTFAHSITTTDPFGAPTIFEQVVRLNEDGTEGEEVVTITGDNPNALSVDPAATSVGYVGPDAADFLRSWGPGVYEMRVYVGETLIARGQFRLAAG
ncbi:MAG: hypothetical protein ACRDGD_11775 [Candidatus Limnocylindria bacterium]